MPTADTAPKTFASKREVPIDEFVPDDIRQTIEIAPAEDWVASREVDVSYRPGLGGAYTALLIDKQYHVQRHASYSRTVVRLEALQAVHDAAHWRIDRFDPAVQRLIIHSIAIERAGRRMEWAEIRRLRFLQRDARLPSIDWNGGLSIVVLLEDVRIGDLLDVSYTIVEKPRLMPSSHWVFAKVPRELPTLAFHVRVLFPEGGDGMQWRTSVDLSGPKIGACNGAVEWTWHLDKVTRRGYEPEAPGSQLLFSWIQTSTCNSWAEVAEGVRAAWPECFGDALLNQTAARLAAESDSQRERAAKVFRLVQDEVRSDSSRLEENGWLPTLPGTVLERRVGSGKDKAFLLMHLLRLLGISCRPVLVSAAYGSGVDFFLPMPAAFDHVVIEYEIEGERRGIDPELTFQGGGALERFFPDFGVGLAIGPGSAQLDKLPASPSRDAYQLKESFLLDTSGRPPALRVIVTAQGEQADKLRRAFGTEGAEAVSRQRDELYAELFTEPRRLDPIEMRDDRARNEFVLGETYELPAAFAQEEGNTAMTFKYRSHLIQGVLSLPDMQKRSYPLLLKSKGKFEHFIELNSPTFGRSETVTTLRRDCVLRFSHAIKKSFGRWIYLYTLRITDPEAPAHHFENLRKTVEEIREFTTIALSLKRGVATPRMRRDRSLPDPSKAAAPLPNATGQRPVTADHFPLSPAPPLRPAATNAATTGANSRHSAQEAQSESDGPPDAETIWPSFGDDAAQREAEADEDSVEGETAETPARRRGSARRRRRTNQRSKKPIKRPLMGIAIALFAILTWWVCHVALHKKLAAPPPIFHPTPPPSRTMHHSALETDDESGR